MSLPAQLAREREAVALKSGRYVAVRRQGEAWQEKYLGTLDKPSPGRNDLPAGELVGARVGLPPDGHPMRPLRAVPDQW